MSLMKRMARLIQQDMRMNKFSSSLKPLNELVDVSTLLKRSRDAIKNSAPIDVEDQIEGYLVEKISSGSSFLEHGEGDIDSFYSIVGAPSGADFKEVLSYYNNQLKQLVEENEEYKDIDIKMKPYGYGYDIGIVANIIKEDTEDGPYGGAFSDYDDYYKFRY